MFLLQEAWTKLPHFLFFFFKSRLGPLFIITYCIYAGSNLFRVLCGYKKHQVSKGNYFSQCVQPGLILCNSFMHIFIPGIVIRNCFNSAFLYSLWK